MDARRKSETFDGHWYGVYYGIFTDGARRMKDLGKLTRQLGTIESIVVEDMAIYRRRNPWQVNTP